MNTIEETVKYIRSKNAGPFWLTIDAFAIMWRIQRELRQHLRENGNLLPRHFRLSQRTYRFFVWNISRWLRSAFRVCRLREAVMSWICMADSIM